MAASPLASEYLHNDHSDSTRYKAFTSELRQSFLLPHQRPSRRGLNLNPISPSEPHTSSHHDHHRNLPIHFNGETGAHGLSVHDRELNMTLRPGCHTNRRSEIYQSPASRVNHPPSLTVPSSRESYTPSHHPSLTSGRSASNQRYPQQPNTNIHQTSNARLNHARTPSPDSQRVLHEIEISLGVLRSSGVDVEREEVSEVGCAVDISSLDSVPFGAGVVVEACYSGRG